MDGKLLIIGVLLIVSCAGKNILEVVEDEIENMDERMYADGYYPGKGLKMWIVSIRAQIYIKSPPVLL